MTDKSFCSRIIDMTQPVLETERLILEPFKDCDVNDVFDYASDPEIAKTVTWEPHKNIDASREYLSWIQKHSSGQAGKIFFVWAIREKKSGKVIGSIDFKNIFPHSGQLDYALGRIYWNSGFATEVAKEVVRWAFSEIPELVRFQSYCIADNIGSRRVMEKSGLQLEGIRKKSIQVKGKIFDTAHYALVK
jgi:ribosomal-protein-alanine N-acetyltransferase